AFGEGFGIDRAGQAVQERRIERYMHTPGGQPLLPGMLNFTLYGTLHDVIARGQPPAQLAWRIGTMMRLHPRAHWMPSFVDNHDVDRFLAGASPAALKQALLLIFTLPGVPVVTYGTEQGFTEQRAAMFAAGWGAGGRSHFDTQAPLYATLRELAQLRRAHRALTRGTPTVLRANAAAPGVLAYRMRHGRDDVLVLMNTADTATLADNIATGWPAGTQPVPLFSLGEVPAVRADARGHINVVLPARSAVVWRAGAQAAVPRASAGTAAPQGHDPSPQMISQAPPVSDSTSRPTPTTTALSIDPLPAADTRHATLRVTGRAAPHSDVAVVVDGGVAHAQQVQASATGHWQATLALGDMI
ncbi:MAG: DUF3459 domain-containing protein, partial [Betaproteobacteria bacterium]|nr:DUF3459 domain-containing protein [Betaproteobacteria bacterium]